MKNTTSDEDGKRTLFFAILIAAITIAALLIPSPPSVEAPSVEPEPQHVPLVEVAHAAAEEVVEKPVEKEIPKLHPELAVICDCESAGYPHKNSKGELLSGFIDSDDKGECQINTRYHGDTMKRMGLDITDDADYYTYANHLFETQGKQPWSASAACWAPIIGY